MSHTDANHPTPGSRKYVVALIIVAFVAYTILLSMGKPQQWTQAELDKKNLDVHIPGMMEVEESLGHIPEHSAEEFEAPPIFTIIPFVTLLLCIAFLPLIPATSHWWESNANRFLVAASLGVVTLLYYLFFHNSPIEAHWPGEHCAEPSEGLLNLRLTWTVFENAILYEFIPFIVLLFTLYTIAGGIRIEGNLKAKPLTNTAIIAIGGSLASFIGTTGAAMLLIRLLLDTNKNRKHVVHTVVFFIFIVCNCGGLLTPLGDPPLFLGYLRGVGFGFTLTYLFFPWLFVNGMLLMVYFTWDSIVAYPRDVKDDVAGTNREAVSLKFTGLWPNGLLLLGVIASVLFLYPDNSIFGWHPWYYFREIVMLGLVFLSLTLCSGHARMANGFNYAAIIEVAALFFGIFICMQAPLQILHIYGSQLPFETPMQFFWISGGLAPFLDNAPTYVVFFEAAKTKPVITEAVMVTGGVIDLRLLIAVSLASVFMGAMTYIGNGPNFMVKAIVEVSGIKMPSFFGFMAYSCLILLPIFIAMSLIFLQ